MTSLSKLIKKIRLKLVRYHENQAPGINIDELKFGTIYFADESLGRFLKSYQQDRFSPQSEAYNKHPLHAPLLNRQAINRLVSHGDYEVVEIDGQRILYNKYKKVPGKLRHRWTYMPPHEGTVQKQNSRKKRARRAKLAREKWLARYIPGALRLPEYRAKSPDPYSINEISNTSFGHPRRKFNLEEKRKANAERRHKQRNTPPYSDS